MGMIIVNFLQLLLSMVIIVVYGIILSYLSKFFYRSVGSRSTFLMYVTGFVGTPVHELGHAIMCLIFGHKIVEMKLYQIDQESGCLGYVSHKYNPKSRYQKLGNFFIGIGPIILGSLVLMLLMRIFVPYVLAEWLDITGNIANGRDIWTNIVSLFSVLLSVDNLSYWGFWVFVILGFSIALHMNLSPADIKGSVSGVALLLVLFVVISVIGGLLSGTYNIAEALVSFNIYIIAILTISLFLVLIMALLGCVLRLIFGRR